VSTASDSPPTGSTPSDPPAEVDEPSGNGILAALRETVIVVGIALVLSLLVKTFLVQAFFIPSQSMEDTLLIGDRVVVSKLTPGPFDLDRGDVVVFTDPGGWLTPMTPPDDGPIRGAIRSTLTFVGLLPNDSGNHLIKRLIGLPATGSCAATTPARSRSTARRSPSPTSSPATRRPSAPSTSPCPPVGSG
jgi:signal peptidase I